MDVDGPSDSGATVSLTRTNRPLTVTVLMGGPSAEREISLLSGEAIAAGLERAGHTVRRQDISPADTRALDAEDVDLVFIALHGEFGESGEVQELCEERGVRYIGSEPYSSRLAMAKAASKQAFLHVGLCTPDWIVIEEYHDPRKVARWLGELPPPVVIKPVAGGSSLDITIVHDTAARDRALEDVLDKYSRAMVERYVPGREFTVGILGEQALPVLEIVPPGEFYDYEAKYTDCGTRYVFDHGLDESLTAAMEAAALDAHQTLQCRDLSRVDFILDSDNRAQVLEINTIPGFTSHSLLPMAAASVGVCFERLVDGIAAMAMEREPREIIGHRDR